MSSTFMPGFIWLFSVFDKIVCVPLLLLNILNMTLLYLFDLFTESEKLSTYDLYMENSWEK